MPRRATLKKNGPAPVSPAVHELHGNPGHLPTAIVQASEPQGRGDLWSPPQHFDDDQRAAWIYAVENAPFGLLTGTDRGVLSIWCVAFVEHARATRKVSEFGQVIGKKGELRKNPYIAICAQQAMLMLRAGGEMGFSPAARAVIGRASAVAGAGGFPNGAPKQIEGGGLDAYLAAKPDKLPN